MSSISFTHKSVLDISGGKIDQYLKSRLKSSLIDAYNNSETPYLPEEFLYLKNGLHIWRDLVYNPKYYQTHDEIDLFRKNGQQIADYMADNCILIDLGSGFVEITFFNLIRRCILLACVSKLIPRR